MDKRQLVRRTLVGMGGAILVSGAIAVPALAVAGTTTMATTAPLRLRSGASMGASVETVIPAGTSVQVYGMTAAGWYDVEYDGQRGYSWYKYLDFEGDADGDVNNGKITDMYATQPLRVRSQPSTGSDILGVLQTDEAVAVTAKHDNWFTVNYNGQTGYCYGGYLGFGQSGADQTSTGATTDNTMNDLTTTDQVNVRAQPSTGSAILGTLGKGESVRVTGTSGDWDQIDYGGATGYVYSAYLE
ncbi:MAG: SH3 domain-containing protein [Atopobiaceae bacterium]|jgi:uncharacterized protein YgiM (DUF1202 family)|nr:SH3 domain-containing protein [Atopobiaceae bacterium]